MSRVQLDSRISEKKNHYKLFSLLSYLCCKELAENKTTKDSQQAKQHTPQAVHEDERELSILREPEGLVAKGGEGGIGTKKANREE